MDIIKALEITGQTAGNWAVEDALATVREKVHEGVPIAQPLIDNDVFPPMVAQMVKIGEETESREDAFEDRGLLRRRGRLSIQSLTSIIEPLMMIAVGCMVGVIIIAMYLPMFKMLTLLHDYPVHPINLSSWRARLRRRPLLIRSDGRNVSSS